MDYLIAMTHGQGVALTIVIIIVLVLLGCLVITDDFNWFDDC